MGGSAVALRAARAGRKRGRPLTRGMTREGADFYLEHAKILRLRLIRQIQLRTMVHVRAYRLVRLLDGQAQVSKQARRLVQLPRRRVATDRAEQRVHLPQSGKCLEFEGRGVAT